MNNKQDEGITVQITNHLSGLDINKEQLTNMANTICARFGIHKANINIEVVDDVKIAELNKQFLQQNSSTDCLSFDLSEETAGIKSFDIMVNGQMAQRQGQRLGHSAEAEIALYIAHGLLHNLGYDDITAEDAKKMHMEEDKILTEFGYGKIYNKDK